MDAKPYRLYCLWQCLLAALMTLGILFALAAGLKMDILGAIGASSLASSTGLVLMTPNVVMAKTKNLIGGYLCGIMVGGLCYFGGVWFSHLFSQLPLTYDYIFLGALAVGLTQWLMVYLDMEHSPGVGLALGLVLEDWRWISLVVIMVCIVLIAFIRYLLRNRLINLLCNK